MVITIKVVHNTASHEYPKYSIFRNSKQSPFNSVGLASIYGIGEAPYTSHHYLAPPILPFDLVVVVLMQALGRLFLSRYTM